jgi:hypothetical protein
MRKELTGSDSTSSEDIVLFSPIVSKEREVCTAMCAARFDEALVRPGFYICTRPCRRRLQHDGPHSCRQPHRPPTDQSSGEGLVCDCNYHYFLTYDEYVEIYAESGSGVNGLASSDGFDMPGSLTLQSHDTVQPRPSDTAPYGGTQGGSALSPLPDVYSPGFLGSAIGGGLAALCAALKGRSKFPALLVGHSSLNGELENQFDFHASLFKYDYTSSQFWSFREAIEVAVTIDLPDWPNPGNVLNAVYRLNFILRKTSCLIGWHRLCVQLVKSNDQVHFVRIHDDLCVNIECWGYHVQSNGPAIALCEILDYAASEDSPTFAFDQTLRQARAELALLLHAASSAAATRDRHLIAGSNSRSQLCVP